MVSTMKIVVKIIAYVFVAIEIAGPVHRCSGSIFAAVATATPEGGLAAQFAIFRLITARSKIVVYLEFVGDVLQFEIAPSGFVKAVSVLFVQL